MPEVNQIQTLLPASVAAQMPPDVRARMLAGQLASQQAAAPKAPYSSRAAGLVSALTGGLGGLVEGQAVNQAMAGQRASAANMVALADAVRGSQGGGAPAGGATAAPMPNAMPMGQGGVGSDHAAAASGSSRDLAIRTIYGEAGGEPAEGQAGVAAVLKNRLAGGHYGNDMQSVIMAPKQFSLWNKGDPAGDSARKLDPSSPAYQRIGQIYDGVMSGQIPDPTGGATHYYNPHVASPAWGPQLAQQNDVRIGNHRFVGTGPTGPGAAQPQTAQADMPAANAQPVSMAGLPPGVTPAMFAASQNTATDGNALHRGDEMPVGAPPFVPGGGPQGPSQPPIGPATSNAMLAKAVSDWKPDLGTTQPAVVPDPVTASTPDAPPAPSVLPPVQPPSGPGTAGAPVVLPPQGTLVPPPAPASDGSLRGDLIAAAQKQGMDVAMDPVVPDPAGTLVPPAPSSPNTSLAGPQSDAAMGNAAPDAGPMAAAAPAGLPDTAPLPPPGGQTPQVMADQAAAAGPMLDPEGAGPANYDTSAAPSLRDALVAAMNGGGSAPPAAPPPGPGPAPAAPPVSAPPAAQTAGLSLPSADDPVGGLVGAPGAPAAPPAPGGPASPPLPTLAGADVPPPVMGGSAGLPQDGPMPPSRPQMLASAIMGQGGAGLPSTGPMPPARPSDQALGLNPDAPAPGAVPTGPAPMQADPGPMSSAPQPLGLSGDGGGDKSSARAFLTAEAIRNSGAPAAQRDPQALAAVIQGQPIPSAAPAPAAPQGGGMGGMLGGLFGLGSGRGGGQAPSAAASSSGFPGQPPSSATGAAGAPPAPSGPAMGGGFPQAPGPGAPSGAAPQAGNYQQARAIAGQILGNPYSSPQAQEMAAKVLFPQSQITTGADGKTYAVNAMDGTARLLFDGGAKFDPNQSLLQGGHFTQAPDKPLDLAPGHTAVTFGANNQAIPQVRAPETPDMEAIPNTPYFHDKHSATIQQGPAGMGAQVVTPEIGSVKVPQIVTPNGQGGFNQTGVLPAGQGGQTVDDMVRHQQQLEAQGAAAKENATGQVKGAQTFVDTTAKQAQEAATHVQELQQLKALSAKAPTGWSADIARFTSGHGYVTPNGDAVQNYDGLRAYLGTQLRQAGSGALRNSEMDKLSDALGSTNASPEARNAALQRVQDGFARQAALGQIASDPSAPDAMAKQARIQNVTATWQNADAAIEAHPDKKAAIIAKMQSAGYPVVGF